MTPPANTSIAGTFEQLGLNILVRGWLSSNNIVFSAAEHAPATVVDTGYASHAQQTVALVTRLCPAGVRRIVNTHLHSDHCGGNAALQARWSCDTFVPESLVAAVHAWDTAGRLTFESVDQRCERFSATCALRDGDSLQLGPAQWQIYAAPGHDPDAVMLFEPTQRVLISGDALWEARLAIIFPELVGEPGFDAAMQTLDLIESLRPAIVVPGHGEPFSSVAASIDAGRRRLNSFANRPEQHNRYAARALLMFRMLERRQCARGELVRWMADTPLLFEILRRSPQFGTAHAWAGETIDRLVSDGVLTADTKSLVSVP